MVAEGFREMSRLAAAEGAVLLKNDGVLPIKNERTAVFGRCQLDYIKSGTGSGGAVNSLYVTNILEGFRENPYINVDEEIVEMYERLVAENPSGRSNTFEAAFKDIEFDIPEETIKAAAARNDKAVIVIGRVAGESYDNADIAGSFRLTLTELNLIERVAKYFPKFAVLLNVGNIIDMSWVEQFSVPTVMYIWQGGEEGGRAAADVVSGIVAPSGKLTDTIAKSYDTYPSSANFSDENEIIYAEDIFVGYRYFETFARDDVLYPFGFGLTYTEFSINVSSVRERSGIIELTLSVKNIGKNKGREVVQIYAAPPTDPLTNPARILVAFAKTSEINPNGTETVTLKFNRNALASYDDSGASGYKNAWVLQKGTYNIYAGSDIRSAKPVYAFNIGETTVIEQCESRLTPNKSFERMINRDGKIEYESVLINTGTQNQAISNENHISEYDKDFTTAAKEGHITEFADSLSDNELMAISRGEGMLSPRVTPGTASCFAGVTDTLIARGVPTVCTSDGPSGLRMDSGEPATSMPCGTLLACTWDTDLIEELYKFEGKEAALNRIDMLLGPGMNIHRDPLCGRNFEYFSEDPLLSGTIAAAAVRGMNAAGTAAVIKHFACNNREQNRWNVSSLVSERTLREIYLRGFEIAVKTAPVLGIMTSYNRINGLQSASNPDLTDAILRGEWGYDGVVMTDWWALMNERADEDGSAKKLAAMARAHNDLYMVVPNMGAAEHDDDMKGALVSGKLTRTELIRNAVSILTTAAKLPCFERMHGFRLHPKRGTQKQFICEKRPRTFNTQECIIKQQREYVHTVLSDMINIADTPIKREYNTECEPASEIAMTLVCERSCTIEIQLDISADAPKLAQLGIFIQYRDTKISVPIDNIQHGDTKTISAQLNINEGWNNVKFSFARSNTAPIMLHAMTFKIL